MGFHIRAHSESSFEQWTREAYEEIGEGFVKIYFYLFVRQFCLMRVLAGALGHGPCSGPGHAKTSHSH